MCSETGDRSPVAIPATGAPGAFEVPRSEELVATPPPVRALRTVKGARLALARLFHQVSRGDVEPMVASALTRILHVCSPPPATRSLINGSPKWRLALRPRSRTVTTGRHACERPRPPPAVSGGQDALTPFPDQERKARLVLDWIASAAGKPLAEMTPGELDRLEALLSAGESMGDDAAEQVLACMDQNQTVIDLARRRALLDRGPFR